MAISAAGIFTGQYDIKLSIFGISKYSSYLSFSCLLDCVSTAFFLEFTVLFQVLNWVLKLKVKLISLSYYQDFT